jgi:hypothetical protein
VGCVGEIWKLSTSRHVASPIAPMAASLRVLPAMPDTSSTPNEACAFAFADMRSRSTDTAAASVPVCVTWLLPVPGSV